MESPKPAPRKKKENLSLQRLYDLLLDEDIIHDEARLKRFLTNEKPDITKIALLYLRLAKEPLSLENITLIIENNFLAILKNKLKIEPNFLNEDNIDSIVDILIKQKFEFEDEGVRQVGYRPKKTDNIFSQMVFYIYRAIGTRRKYSEVFARTPHSIENQKNHIGSILKVLFPSINTHLKISDRYIVDMIENLSATPREAKEFLYQVVNPTAGPRGTGSQTIQDRAKAKVRKYKEGFTSDKDVLYYLKDNEPWRFLNFGQDGIFNNTFEPLNEVLPTEMIDEYRKEGYEWTYFNFVNIRSAHYLANSNIIKITPETFEYFAITPYEKYQKLVDKFQKGEHTWQQHHEEELPKKTIRYTKWSNYNLYSTIRSIINPETDGFHITVIPIDVIKNGNNPALGVDTITKKITIYSMRYKYLENIYRSLVHPIRQFDMNVICKNRLFSLDTLRYVAWHDFFVSKNEIYVEPYAYSLIKNLSGNRGQKKLIVTDQELYDSVCNLIEWKIDSVIRDSVDLPFVLWPYVLPKNQESDEKNDSE